MTRQQQVPRQQKNPYMVVGLDIGTTKILVVMGLLREDGKIEVCGYGRVPSQGVEYGQVFNVQETTDSIIAACKELASEIDEPVSDVYVGVAGRHIRSMGCTNSLFRPNGLDALVSAAEIQKMTDDMENYSVPNGGDIIAVIPQSYEVDGVQTLRPVGTLGQTVRGQYQIIVGDSLEVRKLTKSVTGAELNVRDLLLEPVASAAVCLTEQEKKQGVALVDIGGGTSDLIIFEQGVPIYIKVIPVGGNAVTRDIQSIGLSFEQAEALKVKHGTCLMDNASSSNIITIPDDEGYGTPTTISEYNLARIIQARVQKDILEAVKNEIEASGYASRVRTVVLTGGGAMIRDIRQLSDFVIQRKTRVGYPVNGFTSTMDSSLKDPMCSTALGLLKVGCLAEKNPYIEPETASQPDEEYEDEGDEIRNPIRIKDIGKKLGDWFKKFKSDGLE